MMNLRILNRLRGSVVNVLRASRFSSSVEGTGAKEINTEPNSRPIIDPDVNPLMKTRELELLPKFSEPRQAWIETLNCIDDKIIGLTTLHPEVFGVGPRIDMIHLNVKWQRNIRYVSFAHAKTRHEMPGTRRKPRPQKGLGMSRHGDLRSPLFTKTGGVAHGPRSPTPHFFVLGIWERIIGLTSTLSIKHAQDDLHIVDSLDIPTENKGYIQDLVEARKWGPSVLMVDVPDLMPRNITVATDEIKHINLMPVYGLNVYSMLKHDTLILTVDAVKRIEEKILYQLNRIDKEKVCGKFEIDQ
nr:PREDICTED: 39S ribosomal protein L4, mitochondrial [Bemisia tabaci]